MTDSEATESYLGALGRVGRVLACAAEGKHLWELQHIWSLSHSDFRDVTNVAPHLEDKGPAFRTQIMSSGI